MAQSYMKLDQYSNALTALEGVGVKSNNKEEYNLLYLDILMTLEYYPEAEAKVKQLLKVHTEIQAIKHFLRIFITISATLRKHLKSIRTL